MKAIYWMIVIGLPLLFFGRMVATSSLHVTFMAVLSTIVIVAGVALWVFALSQIVKP